MTINVEDGTGVSGANAYVNAAFVTTYLADRNRATQNSWNTIAGSVRDGAIVSATDFIEQRWGLRFMGQREFRDISAARATLTFTVQPLTAETVTIGATIFTFGISVTIGASIAATIDNLVTAAITHPDVTTKAGPGNTLVVIAKIKGTPGNAIATTTTVVAGASWSSATLLGGGDVLVPQALSFPRLQLFDREGLAVLGIPPRLKQATAEYAVRAVSATLMPDPTINASGRTVISVKEKIGPIDTATEFEPGGALSQLIRPYPAADRLLSEYVTAAGGVIRG